MKRKLWIKTITGLLLAVSLLFTACHETKPTAVNGESSESKTVNEAKTETEKGVEYMNRILTQDYVYRNDFGAFRSYDFTEGELGFVAFQGNSFVEGASLFYEEGKNGYLLSPSDLSIPADVVTTVEFRIKTKNADHLTMFWRERQEGFYAENSGTIEILPDGEFHDYQIHLANQEEWSGAVDQLAFSFGEGAKAELQYVRITGLYLVPFPWIGSEISKTLLLFETIKEAFVREDHLITVGFAFILEYLKDDESGELLEKKLNYAVLAAKASNLPIMIWFRADPWGEMTSGLGEELYSHDENLMWTEELTAKPAYRRSETGYYDMCLAETDLDGKQTDYWRLTEQQLSMYAEKVQKVIEENPGLILGVNTTAEYRFMSSGFEHILDYNPRTIKEFASYCEKQYPSIEAFNQMFGTAFTTYELLSTDYDPTTVENKGGFDAPRDIRRASSEFRLLWREFRASQIHRAVQHLVDIIGAHIDKKYIYTHQISYDDDLTCSPITCGDAEGANIGIDFFNHEANNGKFIPQINEMIGDDLSRTWGCPEWMVETTQSYEASLNALKNMINGGAKYISPFNWGSDNMYNFKGEQSGKAVRDYVDAVEAKYGRTESIEVESKDIPNVGTLSDSDDSTYLEYRGFDGNVSMTFKFREKTRINSIRFSPNPSHNLSLGTISVSAKGEELGVFELGADKEQWITVVFRPIDTDELTISVTEPAQNSSGETELTIGTISLGFLATEDDIPGSLQGIQCDTSTSGRLTFMWDASVGADGYCLEISDSADFVNTSRARTDKTTITIKALNKAPVYYYRVWAVNDYGVVVSEVGQFASSK